MLNATWLPALGIALVVAWVGLAAGVGVVVGPMNAIAAGAATVAAGVWFTVWWWAVYDTIQSDGSWYNELKINDRNTFINRAIVTFRDRMVVWKTVGLLVVVFVFLWAFTYVFTVGLLAVVG